MEASMLPERHWWRGNPHYDALWTATTAQERLQRRVLEALLQALPEAAGKALVDELLAARHPGQVQALRIAELTQGAIDVVLQAAADQAVIYKLRNEAVSLVPLQKLQQWTAADLDHRNDDHGSIG